MGGGTVCYVRPTDGSVVCWGENQGGQRGDDYFWQILEDRFVEVNLSGAATAVSVSGSHGCAVMATGKMECWGRDNASGELGCGGCSRTGYEPVEVSLIGSTLPGAVRVSVTLESSCALLTDGSVACWGRGQAGELGDGPPTQSGPNLPEAPSLLEGYANTSGAYLPTAGELFFWGTPPSTGEAWKTKTLTDFGVGNGFVCGVLPSGAVECLGGQNTQGQLGDGTNDPSPEAWVPVVGIDGSLASATQVDVGLRHACAVLDTGGVRCWGLGNRGQLGDGNTTASNVPLDVVGLASAATHVSAGPENTCAVLDTGAIQCWGRNVSGTLGVNDDSISQSPTPVTVFGIDGTLASAVSVVASNRKGCAILDSGEVRCWGFTNAGDGVTVGPQTLLEPVTLTEIGSTLAAAEKVVMSRDLSRPYVCALLTDGALACWGSAASTFPVNNEALGGAAVLAPTPMYGIDGVSRKAVDVLAGPYHLCVQLDTGDIECHGINTSGQLGFLPWRATPAPVLLP